MFRVPFHSFLRAAAGQQRSKVSLFVRWCIEKSDYHQLTKQWNTEVANRYLINFGVYFSKKKKHSHTKKTFDCCRILCYVIWWYISVATLVCLTMCSNTILKSRVTSSQKNNMNIMKTIIFYQHTRVVHRKSRRNRRNIWWQFSMASLCICHRIDAVSSQMSAFWFIIVCHSWCPIERCVFIVYLCLYLFRFHHRFLHSSTIFQ